VTILAERTKEAGLWCPDRVVIIGCGGIGSNLWDLIAHQTYYSAKLSKQGYYQPYVSSFLLVDGDAVESKNLFRQSFFARHVGMGKAEALSDKYSRELKSVNILVEFQRAWLTENSTFLNENDMILFGVDNNASRKILNDMISPKRKNMFKNIIAVNGGNTDSLVTVQLMVKTRGKIDTATFEHRHPELTNPGDKHPRHVECTSAQGMAEDPQLYRANQHAADLMFNIYQNALECRFVDFCGIWSDVSNMNFRKDAIPDSEIVIE
jgi:hypothetical protein